MSVASDNLYWPRTRAGDVVLEACGILVCLALTAAVLALIALGVLSAYSL